MPSSTEALATPVEGFATWATSMSSNENLAARGQSSFVLLTCQFGQRCYLSIRFGPRSFRYATMSSTSSSVSMMSPPRVAEPTGSSASVKLKNR